MRWHGTTIGTGLRFSAPPDMIENFYANAQPHLAAFTLFGSGDFHHLAALWMRRIREPPVPQRICHQKMPELVIDVRDRHGIPAQQRQSQGNRQTADAERHGHSVARQS